MTTSLKCRQRQLDGVAVAVVVMVLLLAEFVSCLSVNASDNASQRVCRTGEFACGGNGGRCLSDSLVCNGKEDCPGGEDELTSLCESRTCGSHQFKCRLPGHCVPASSRCDNKIDCGEYDSSDEANCGQMVCQPGTISCYGAHNQQKCVAERYVCDGLADCADGSDEADCPLKCHSNQFECDSKCLPLTAKCDGRRDCVDGSDEKSCNNSPCTFMSEFKCKYSDGQCVSNVFTCDEHPDCDKGEDEVCPVKHRVCQSENYWTCKSGTHCVPHSVLCDGLAQCPDGSDESNCYKAEPTKKQHKCPIGYHLCNGTSSHCVDPEAVCFGRDNCPHPDKKVDEVCHRLHSARSPCRISNGGCEQICDTRLRKGSLTANCSCRAGFAVSPSDPRRCVDVDECKRFGACSQACSNTIGSFACGCSQGYSLHGNQCHANIRPVVLYSTRHDIRSLDGAVLSGLHHPRLLAFDAAQRLVFFVSSDNSVGSFSLDDNSTTRLLAADVGADAVAYDWTRRLLYFATPGAAYGSLLVLNVTNGALANLRRLDCPRGLAVHPVTGEIFVSLWCSSPTGIFAVKPNGGTRVVVTGVGMPTQLALDLSQFPARLYWVDSNSESIFSSRLDGSDLRAHWRHQGHPGSVAVFEDRLYWSDMKQNVVMSVDKFDGGELKRLASAHSTLAVAVMHPLLQPQQQLHASVGNCTHCRGHICISLPGSEAVCLCDREFQLDKATNSCVSNYTEPKAYNGLSAWEAAAAAADSSASSLPLGAVTLGVAACLTCLILLIALTTIVCIRRRRPYSLSFANESFGVGVDPDDKRRRLANVDSRTALTDAVDDST